MAATCFFGRRGRTGPALANREVRFGAQDWPRHAERHWFAGPMMPLLDPFLVPRPRVRCWIARADPIAALMSWEMDRRRQIDLVRSADLGPRPCRPRSLSPPINVATAASAPPISFGVVPAPRTTVGSYRDRRRRDVGRLVPPVRRIGLLTVCEGRPRRVGLTSIKEVHLVAWNAPSTMTTARHDVRRGL
jgi:hypothetical protein